MLTEENTLNNENINKGKVEEIKVKKEEEKNDINREKEENKEIDENDLDNLKYEKLKEDIQEYDLSFKVIVIGDSGKQK